MTNEVRDNPALHRYELDVEGHVAFAEYRLAPDTITFVHTVVPNELSGRGIGSRLAKSVLEAVRKRDLRVVAECPFMAGYIGKHPEVQDLLA
jgi:predicted GNAT family acetyltransferase